MSLIVYDTYIKKIKYLAAKLTSEKDCNDALNNQNEVLLGKLDALNKVDAKLSRVEGKMALINKKFSNIEKKLKKY